MNEGTGVGGPAKSGDESPSVWRDMVEIVNDLIHARELLIQLALRDLRLRYKQAVMGLAWAVLMPALIVGSGVIIKYAFAYVGGGTVDARDVLGMMVKALPWAFFVGAINFSTVSLTGNMNLLTKIYFPREVLPCAAVCVQGIDTAIGTGVLAIMLPLLGWVPSWSVLFVPLLIVMLIALTLAAALVLSCANLFFRDVKYLVQILLSFGIFFTPVFYEPMLFGPTGASLMMLNPIAPILEGLRLSIVEGHSLFTTLMVPGHGQMVEAWSPWLLAYSAVWGFMGLGLGAVLFHRLQFVFAEYV